KGQPGDAVALATDRSRVPLEFALRHSHLRDELIPAFPRTPWGKFHTGMQKGEVLPASTADALPAKYDRVWVLAGFYDPANEINDSLTRMRNAGYRQVSAHTYGGPLALYLFQRE